MHEFADNGTRAAKVVVVRVCGAPHVESIGFGGDGKVARAVSPTSRHRRLS